jgi:hypothetical protein
MPQAGSLKDFIGAISVHVLSLVIRAYALGNFCEILLMALYEISEAAIMHRDSHACRRLRSAAFFQTLTLSKSLASLHEEKVPFCVLLLLGARRVGDEGDNAKSVVIFVYIRSIYLFRLFLFTVSVLQ